ncbi:MAG TPA: hypothetical protein VIW80_19010 [Pyrinomonadaceae bacterium]
MIIRTLGCAALTAVSSSAALAQCAMCRAAVASSADSAARASGMNLAVMVLLIPPLAMFCAFFVAAYRFRKAPGETLASDLPDESATRRAGLLEVDQTGRDGLGAKGDCATRRAPLAD